MTPLPHARDLRDRKKMAAFAYASARGRTAASNYRLLEPLAGGAAALVQWRLETGRTHQVGGPGGWARAEASTPVEGRCLLWEPSRAATCAVLHAAACSRVPPQIRVHAKHIGHPLFGDETYSSTAAAGSIVGAGRPPRTAAAQAAARRLGRPALHAKTLGFLHPATGERLLFDSELPPDLAAALDALRSTPFV